MKRVFYFIIVLLLSVSSIWAQGFEGRDFWLTFGQNSSGSHLLVNLQIRIISGNEPTTGIIYFTNLDTEVHFDIGAQEVFPYPLDNTEKQAVYNTMMGISNCSIHITTNHPVTVYALNQLSASTDATNILPVKALDADYYQISYTPYSVDAYAVVATKDNTNLSHNGVWEATLDAGKVYYRTSSSDMTGFHITADNPVAFFAVSRGVLIPVGYTATDCLFQQLAPVNTWGQTFFVPVSHLAKDRVRIIASQDNTFITQTGGTHISAPGGQTGPYTIDAGEYIELEALLTNNGCYIYADKPVGVCTYLVGAAYNGMWISDPAQCWLPAIEQTVTEALIAPFAPSGGTQLNAHYALVITPTATQANTKVSIGGAAPAPLSGGIWRDHSSGMSFYTMPLTNFTESYYFTNDAGLIILCYGTGTNESYYFLAGSAMRDLQAAFYANDIHYQDLEEQPFCENLVEFRAETENMGVEVVSLEWYIDGIEYLPAHNQETWSKTFAIGEYEIKMLVYFENDETLSKTGILKIVSCGTSAKFYANDIHHSALQDTIFCAKNVDFHAEIEGLSPDAGSLKWFIDGVEETAAQDMLDWSKEFETGVYEIKMEVVYEDNTTATITGTLKVEVFWIKMKNITH